MTALTEEKIHNAIYIFSISIPVNKPEEKAWIAGA